MSLHPDFLATITLDDLPAGDLRITAEVCGLDVALALCREMSGTQIRISRNALKDAKIRFIRDNHKAYSPKQLACMLDLDERVVYYVLQGLRREEQKERDQYQLFMPNSSNNS
jgi:hypothetical protein